MSAARPQKWGPFDGNTLAPSNQPQQPVKSGGCYDASAQKGAFTKKPRAHLPNSGVEEDKASFILLPAVVDENVRYLRGASPGVSHDSSERCATRRTVFLDQR